MNITFETNCSEENWMQVIDNYKIKMDLNFINFDRRILYLNKVKDYYTVCKYIEEKLLDTGIIDNFIIVEEYIRDVLDFFDLTFEDLNNDLESISELLAIYLCDTDYLVHFSADTMLEKSSKWIFPGIDILQDFKDVKIASPDCQYINGTLPFIPARSSFNYSNEFCNKCYLIKNNGDFRSKYTYQDYTNRSFKDRISLWMKDNKFKRVVYRHGQYRYPKYNI